MKTHTCVDHALHCYWHGHWPRANVDKKAEVGSPLQITQYTLTQILDIFLFMLGRAWFLKNFVSSTCSLFKEIFMSYWEKLRTEAAHTGLILCIECAGAFVDFLLTVWLELLAFFSMKSTLLDTLGSWLWATRLPASISQPSRQQRARNHFELSIHFLLHARPSNLARERYIIIHCQWHCYSRTGIVSSKEFLMYPPTPKTNTNPKT